MAVIAVIITAPAGAILTNTLGPKWLNHDEDYDPICNECKDAKVEDAEVGKVQNGDFPSPANSRENGSNQDITSKNLVEGVQLADLGVERPNNGFQHNKVQSNDTTDNRVE